jgi:hypothetical protein
MTSEYLLGLTIEADVVAGKLASLIIRRTSWYKSQQRSD